MKLNRKVFAGALALAMGLSAVAPSFAEKTTETKQDTALVLPTGKVDYTWLKELETKANEVVDLYNKMLEARRVEAARKAEYEEAVKKADEARKNRKVAMDRIAALGDEDDEDTLIGNVYYEFYVNLDDYRYYGGLRPTIEDFQLALRNLNGVLSEADDSYIDVSLNKNDVEKQVSTANKALTALRKYNAYEAELEQLNIDLIDLNAEVEVAEANEAEAQRRFAQATNAREAAEEAYDDAIREFAVDADIRNTINEAFRRGDVTILQRIVTEIKKEPVINETIVNEIVEEVLNDGKTAGTPETGDKTVEEKIAELKAAVRKNEIQAAAAKLLMEKNPKAVAPFKADLEKLLATSEALVKKANDAIEKLEKKTSLLVTTAYASEDSEDLDSLIKDINDNTQNISDKLDAVEKDAEKEEETEKPADDEKPAEDNKEEDKKDDNKAPVAKPAGNNAKTGVAGVAGVGAVLAAATAAYVGSKRK